MIEIETTHALTLYLGCLLALFCLIALGHLFKKRTYTLAPTQIIQCEFCHQAFLKTPAQPTARCPRCHCLN